MTQQIFNDATLTPEVTWAGDSYEFSIRLVIGRDYTAGKSRLIFDFPSTLGMSKPSVTHQEQPGYLEAYVSNPDVDYENKIIILGTLDFVTAETANISTRFSALDLGAGLKEGDVVDVRWGSGGRGYGCGAKVTTVVPEQNFENMVHVRYFERPDQPEEGTEVGLPEYGRNFVGFTRAEPIHEEALTFKVHPRETATLHLMRKVDKAILVPRDRFWNVAEVDTATDLVENDAAWVRNQAGAFEVKDATIQIHPKTHPLLETPTMDKVYQDCNIYWGDIHNHSFFSIDCAEREKMPQRPSDLMDYARYNAGLDFYASTDHHEPHQIPKLWLTEDAWNETLEAVESRSLDGEFLAFPGVEYRCIRGDTALVFNGLPGYDTINNHSWNDIRQVWASLKGKDYLSIPHFHNTGNLEEGDWWVEEDGAVESVLEMFSCHGSYEREDALEKKIPLCKPRRFDRYAAYLLKQGYRYGFCANSDGHKGIVGTNGITAVYSTSLDKASILEAYRKRHVYASTNARIRVLFTGNGELMGSVVPTQPKNVLLMDIVGEGTLKKVDLFKDGDHYRCFHPEGSSFQKELVFPDDGPSNWYVRATQMDNHVAWSSPIWFETNG